MIVVQARVGSSRLRGKVLLDVCGKPLLVRMIERVNRIKTPSQVVVATTTLPEDDAIIDVCRDASIEVFRGHPTDLLDRHYQAARHYGADIVAKIPSDCPLIDAQVIDQVFQQYTDDKVDFTSNLHPATFPDGNDVEVMPVGVLATAWREATAAFEREHTTPYIWERPQRFRLSNVLCTADADGTVGDRSMTHRWTIDYPEDYAFIRRVYDELYPVCPDFGLPDIIELLRRKPEIQVINAKYAGVNWYRHHLDELTTIDAKQTRVV